MLSLAMPTTKTLCIPARASELDQALELIVYSPAVTKTPALD
jgi:hypothetical protein